MASRDVTSEVELLAALSASVLGDEVLVADTVAYPGLRIAAGTAYVGSKRAPVKPGVIIKAADPNFWPSFEWILADAPEVYFERVRLRPKVGGQGRWAMSLDGQEARADWIDVQYGDWRSWGDDKALWGTHGGNGVRLKGDGVKVHHLRTEGVRQAFNIDHDAADCEVLFSWGEGIIADYGKVHGTRCRVEHAHAQNFIYANDGNHAGFLTAHSAPLPGEHKPNQAGRVLGVTLRNVTVINSVDPHDPLAPPVQAAGLQDGIAEEWTIENLLHIGRGHMGVSLAGGLNCFMNNVWTLLDIHPITSKAEVRPQSLPTGVMIRCSGSKSGRQASGTIIQNCIANAWKLGSGVTEGGNLTLAAGDYKSILPGFDERDFTPTAKGMLADTSWLNLIPHRKAAGDPASGPITDPAPPQVQPPIIIRPAPEQVEPAPVEPEQVEQEPAGDPQTEQEPAMEPPPVLEQEAAGQPLPPPPAPESDPAPEPEPAKAEAPVASLGTRLREMSYQMAILADEADANG